MRSIVSAAAGALLFVFVSFAWGDEPLLEKGIQVMDGGAPLQVGWFSIPTMVDWNNDGAKDLLVGQFFNGYILLYLNKGTDLNPVFNGGTKIQSNGSPITTTYG